VSRIGSARRGDEGIGRPSIPNAHVQPLTGRALELIVVPLRALVIDNDDDDLALQVPGYAAEVFADHRAVEARISKAVVAGMVDIADEAGLFSPLAPGLRAMRLRPGDSVET
jgi:hypothetical protein